jgi:hypothetical protein
MISSENLPATISDCEIFGMNPIRGRRWTAMASRPLKAASFTLVNPAVLALARGFLRRNCQLPGLPPVV